MMRSYESLKHLKSFMERYEYLKLKGSVGESTFGFDRYLNQALYHSSEWRNARDTVIIRDEGCDLGVPGYEINDRIYIHHMNPITSKGIISRDDMVLDINFLICTSYRTHLAIHYGNPSLLVKELVLRHPGDTKLW